MILDIIVVAPLVILSAIFNSLMDISSQDLFKKDWWNKNKSWKNKYKNSDPEQGPLFLGSTTVFVFVTDGWHLSQFLFHTCWQIAISLIFDQWWWLAFIIIKVLFGLTFEILYRKHKS